MTPPINDVTDEMRIQALEAENRALREQLALLHSQGTSSFISAKFDTPQHVQMVLNRLPSLVGYWDKSLRNKLGNSAYLDWFGIDPTAMVGKTLREVIGEKIFTQNLPFIEGVLRGEPQVFERAIPTPDGRGERHSLAHYIPDMRDGEVCGFFVLVNDITTYKNVEAVLRDTAERLRASEDRLRTIMQDQTEVISRLTRNGDYLFANEVYCRFFGVTERDLIGRRWHPVVHPDDLARVDAELAALTIHQPVVTIENRVFAGDGQVYWMQFVNRGIFNTDGDLVEIQSVGRDITDRKRAEAALQVAHEELQQRVAQLRQLAVDTTLAEERERQAIANDLHDDLGQLLHVAKLKLDGLAKTLLPQHEQALQEINALLATASRSVRSLTSQISPPVLKDLGLIAAFGWLAQEIKHQYGLVVEFTPMVGDVHLPTAQSAIVFRVVRELLINAAKHSGASSASLRVQGDHDKLCVTVADQGSGIADFAATVNAAPGFGWRSMRERIGFLGGDITVSSQPSRGTSVTFYIPIHSAHALNGHF